MELESSRKYYLGEGRLYLNDMPVDYKTGSLIVTERAITADIATIALVFRLKNSRNATIRWEPNPCEGSEKLPIEYTGSFSFVCTPQSSEHIVATVTVEQSGHHFVDWVI